MPSFRTGPVTELLAERTGLQRVRVDLGGSGPERAYVLTRLTGPVAVGERVVVNTTAVELGLGTGGWHVVHWNLDRGSWSEPGPGHIMKLRYTSLQADTGAAEEQTDADGGTGPPGDLARTLAGTGVVVCTLHSQVGVVAAAIAHRRPGTRVAYVMTDGAALPLALSDLVAGLTERGLLVGTVTAGHAFGGDLEAVTIPSGLDLARRRLGADIVVVGMGPGVVGTGSALGTTAVEAASVLDVATALGAEPILCARMSDADERTRHRGLSHHVSTVLGLTRSPVRVALPIRGDLQALDPHAVVEVEVPDVAALLAGFDLHITTMGRGPDLDPLFFDAAAAAAVVVTDDLERYR